MPVAPSLLSDDSQGRYRRGLGLLGSAADRPTLNDYPLMDRAGVAPLGVYDDGSADGRVGFAVPGMIAAPWEGFNHLLDSRQAGGPITPDDAGNALAVAGATAGGMFRRLSPQPPAPQAPIRLYHGTTSNLTEPSNPRFLASKSEDIGPHFGTAEQGNSFALFRDFGQDGSSPRVIPVDAHFQKPFRMPDLGNWDPEDMANAIGSNRMLGPLGLPRISRETISAVALPRTVRRAMAPQEYNLYGGIPVRLPPSDARGYAAVKQWLRQHDYDSIVYNNKVVGEGAGDSYIALKPGTVRTATTGRLLYSDGGLGLLAAPQSRDHY